MHVCKEHARYDAHLRKGEGRKLCGASTSTADESERRCDAVIIHSSSAFCDAVAKRASHSVRYYFSADRNGVSMIYCV